MSIVIPPELLQKWQSYITTPCVISFLLDTWIEISMAFDLKYVFNLKRETYINSLYISIFSRVNKKSLFCGLLLGLCSLVAKVFWAVFRASLCSCVLVVSRQWLTDPLISFPIIRKDFPSFMTGFLSFHCYVTRGCCFVFSELKMLGYLQTRIGSKSNCL